MEVVYSRLVHKKVVKGKIAIEIWEDFKHAFDSFSKHLNFRIFDIKKLIVKNESVYYRLRLGKYRALFRMDQHRIYVENIGPRGGIYKP